MGRSPCLLQAMAQGNADPRRKFGDAEGLGDVIVGAAFQRLDDAGLVGAARQDDDGQLQAGLPPAGQKVVSLNVRQARGRE